MMRQSDRGALPIPQHVAAKYWHREKDLFSDRKGYRGRSKPVHERYSDALAQVSWQDFERLMVAYYAGQGYRVEHAGTAGSGAKFDGGIDLRLYRDDQYIVVQCKHYGGSTFAALRRSVIREVPKLRRLRPARCSRSRPGRRDAISRLRKCAQDRRCCSRNGTTAPSLPLIL